MELTEFIVSTPWRERDQTKRAATISALSTGICQKLIKTFNVIIMCPIISLTAVSEHFLHPSVWCPSQAVPPKTEREKRGRKIREKHSRTIVSRERDDITGATSLFLSRLPHEGKSRVCPFEHELSAWLIGRLANEKILTRSRHKGTRDSKLFSEHLCTPLFKSGFVYRQERGLRVENLVDHL